jgi:hypothetical protein
MAIASDKSNGFSFEKDQKSATCSFAPSPYCIYLITKQVFFSSLIQGNSRQSKMSQLTID